ncbi:MAG: histidinol dehydrogenase [Hadesarchaea archaeon]|nr:histidinol dehydrogenase [Hadesarchaea archaeon]
MSLKVVRLWECSRDERQRLLSRSELDVAAVAPQVRRIVEDVRKKGDEAVIRYTELFDGVRLNPSQLRVSDEEVRKAYGQVDAKVVKAMKSAARAIEKFHRRQLPREWMAQLQPGIKAGQLVRPLASVGIYAPGGLARYPSSVLMAAVPARVAGVGRIVMCTPPRRDGEVDPAMLVAADLAGVETVFRIGGAQAIAAMAYGTRTIPKVDKIVGPGNVYVVAAKQAVASEVEIDFAAGPSEVLILADSSANASYVALDMLAQAEHDPAAAAVLVTVSEELASRVLKFLQRALEEAPRREIAERSLGKYGAIVLARNLTEAVEFVNAYAPEHLQLVVERPQRVLKQVSNAGAIFIGPYSPVAAGDFAVGPNHILPTGGAAKRCSGISVMDFLKLPSVQTLTKEGLRRVAGIVERLAEVEGLPNHARSVRVRLVGREET